jgi:hypothetical protein
MNPITLENKNKKKNIMHAMYVNGVTILVKK